jgi:hypothetical protein
MENEKFTFVVLSHEGHYAEDLYCNRRDADKHFNELCRQMHAKPSGLYVAYYCASVGGLVNACAAS